MSNYKGNTCPVCKKKFTDADDIVVCPDCGTPYHRACWAEVGDCIHADKHAAGYEWKPDFTPDGLPNELICPNCGTHNPATAQTCSHCGIPLPAEPIPSDQTTPGPIYNRPQGTPPSAPRVPGRQGNPQNGVQNGAAGAYHYNAAAADNAAPFRQELSPDDTIDGITARDWASYLGRSSLYYLMQFFRLEQTKHKASVSFSAFFFGPVYFFYRKMWKQGVIFTLITLVLMVPSVLALMAISGSTLVAGLNISTLGTVMTVFSVLDCAQMVFRSAFAAHWYKTGAGKRIHTICDSIPAGESRTDALVVSGGTSFLAVILYFVAFMALSVGLANLLGPNLSAVMQVLYM